MAAQPFSGLCAACRQARVIATERSVFYQCRRAWSDPAFPKYPLLPVLACRGFEPREPAATGENHDGTSDERPGMPFTKEE